MSRNGCRSRQSQDYEVIGLTYDRDRIDEAPQGSQSAIDSRRESAIVIPPGMSVRISPTIGSWFH